MQEALAEIEALEATARRTDPRCEKILAQAKRRTCALAESAEGAERVALLADAVRLADSEGVARVRVLREATPWQREIVAAADGDAWLRWLARANLVDVLEEARLARAGMPAPGEAEEEALRSAAEAARELADPYPRLLSLHRLAATLWQRASLDALEPVLDELDAIEPHAWRRALARAHVGLARGQVEDAREALVRARNAKAPKDLHDYLARLEASLAEGVAIPHAHLVWEHPPFVMSVSPRYELAILLWRALPGGERHARFVAERLRELDPRAEWTRWQADKLGVPAARTHEALLAEVLAPHARRVRHARYGEGTVVREADGKLEIEFASGRKVLLASAVEPLA